MRRHFGLDVVAVVGVNVVVVVGVDVVVVGLDDSVTARTIPEVRLVKTVDNY